MRSPGKSCSVQAGAGHKPVKSATLLARASRHPTDPDSARPRDPGWRDHGVPPQPAAAVARVDQAGAPPGDRRRGAGCDGAAERPARDDRCGLGLLPVQRARAPDPSRARRSIARRPVQRGRPRERGAGGRQACRRLRQPPVVFGREPDRSAVVARRRGVARRPADGRRRAQGLLQPAAPLLEPVLRHDQDAAEQRAIV